MRRVGRAGEDQCVFDVDRHMEALDAMRAEAGKLGIEPAPVDPSELCAHAVDAVALIASRKGVRLESDVRSRRPLLGDQPRLLQVLVNLLGNAVEFTPPGGIVSLYVDEADRGLTCSVRDTGPGIEAADAKAIFTKFWSGSSGGGTGLGLWIASAIVAAHGSELKVESQPGEGTTFSFVLPFAVFDEPTSAAELRSEPPSPSRAS